MTRLLKLLVSPETYRALAFYLATLVLGVVGFALLCAGWPVTICLAITPLVVPLLIGLRAGVGLLAQAEASLARSLLGTDVRPDLSTPGTGFWGRGFEVLKDGAFWRQQVHLLLSWPMAVANVTPQASAPPATPTSSWRRRWGSRDPSAVAPTWWIPRAANWAAAIDPTATASASSPSATGPSPPSRPAVYANTA